jgi:hypothetical protein
LPQGSNWQKPVDAPPFFCYNYNRYVNKMTVKLAILKSGEDVIADIREAISEETNKIVSYIFSDPYVVKLTQPQVLIEDLEQAEKRAYNISVYPWMPLSDDTDIAINPDWVVTIVEPAAKLKQSYEERMNGRGNPNADGPNDGGTIGRTSDVGSDNSSSNLNESVEFNH